MMHSDNGCSYAIKNWRHKARTLQGVLTDDRRMHQHQEAEMTRLLVECYEMLHDYALGYDGAKDGGEVQKLHDLVRRLDVRLGLDCTCGLCPIEEKP